jgi:Permuted papain-like amidase enzyme, YaeF/YiiX, C92 family
MRKMVLLLALIVLLASCGGDTQEQAPLDDKAKINALRAERTKDAYYKVQDAKKLLQEGDLIMRMGDDLTSQNVVQYSAKDKSYSHCGIVLKEGEQMLIYHIIVGEENPGGKLTRVPLDTFCSPNRSIRFGIFRFNINAAELSSFAAAVRKYYAQGLTFDRKFDLDNDDQMYCSEMIMKSLKQATANRLKFEVVEQKEQNFRYFPLDNLYLHPDCKPVKQYSYLRDPLQRPTPDAGQVLGDSLNH